jgi:putative heme-binding domain-containing protein
LEPGIQSLLAANMNDQQREDFSTITENLTPFSEETESLIKSRLSGFEAASKSSAKGAEVFKQQCAICHQVGGAGGNIGPQLDGIGNRGLMALTEKTLDPNRNIAKSFVNYSITLKDGTVRQGLFRRQEGNLLVFADMNGQEFSIPNDDVVQQTALPFTLMPDNFSTIIPEEDYYHLMHYLLEQK